MENIMLSVGYKNGNLISISFCLLKANSLFLLKGIQAVLAVQIQKKRSRSITS